MAADSTAYHWRRLTPEERAEVLAERKLHLRAWHGPPHVFAASGLYLLSAACFEHRSIIGSTSSRMAAYESALVTAIHTQARDLFAWVVLPNHYHAVARTSNIHLLLRALGQLHGRTSFTWNGEDDSRGRQVWHRAAEMAMKSDRHFGATLNYVLHNAVRHGYVQR